MSAMEANYDSVAGGYWTKLLTGAKPEVEKQVRADMAKVPRESNSTRDPNDNGSQFYICVDDNSGLDRTYTVFGEVFRGMDVVDKIVAAARDEADNPLQPIPMTMTVKE